MTCDYCGTTIVLKDGRYQHLFAIDGHPAEHLTQEEREYRESFAERTVEELIR